MSYIGQQLPADVFSGFTIDKFTGDGTANKALTLSKAPFSETTVLVTIDGVVQEPTDDFTVSGTTLTLVGTAANGSEINVTHLSGTVPSTLASKVDLNGVSDTLILDADGDTTISADTDDQIDIKIAGADDFQFTANTFTAQSGSTIAAQALTATTGTFTSNVTISTADNTDTLTLTSTDADASGGPILDIYRNSSSPADDDTIGKIVYRGRNDNTQDVDYGMIEVNIVDASDGTEDGNIIFRCMNGGALNQMLKITGPETVVNDASIDHDFRVESNGEENCLFVSGSGDKVQTGRNSDSGVTETGIDFFNFGQMNIFRAANSLRFAIIFNNTDSSAAIGSITMQSSATAFNTSSDYRLKENVDYDWDATTRLKQLKPARFNWISDDTNTLLEGFMAHEVTSIVPQAVAGEKDQVATAEDVTAGLAKQVGDPVYQGIDQSKLVPLMVKTIQELEARIKTLEDA